MYIIIICTPTHSHPHTHAHTPPSERQQSWAEWNHQCQLPSYSYKVSQQNNQDGYACTLLWEGGVTSHTPSHHTHLPTVFIPSLRSPDISRSIEFRISRWEICIREIDRSFSKKCEIPQNVNVKLTLNKLNKVYVANQSSQSGRKKGLMYVHQPKLTFTYSSKVALSWAWERVAKIWLNLLSSVPHFFSPAWKSSWASLVALAMSAVVFSSRAPCSQHTYAMVQKYQLYYTCTKQK